MGSLSGLPTLVIAVCFVRIVISANNLWDTGQLVPHDDHEQREMTLEDVPEVTMRRQPHAVPLDFFATKINSAHSFHDVFRIFYGDFLSNDDIETMMTSSRNLHSNQRPRLGGVSHNIIPGPHFSSMEGTYPIPVSLDGCVNCYYVPMATVAKETKNYKKHKHMRRRRRRDKRRRTEERRKRKRAREISERMRSSGRRGRRETQRALSHVKEVASGAQCHVPLKKVIRVTTSSPDLEYFPSCTVLYRCSEDTGCCTETERCVAKSKTTISRHFYVLRVLHGLQGIPDTPFVHTMTYENHTECHCQPKPRLPQCLRCPHAVFQITRAENTSCVCDCNMRVDITCNRIKRGRLALHESKLRCIRAGHCHLPICRFGTFDVASGYCPQREMKQRKSKVKPKQRHTGSDIILSSDNVETDGILLTEEELELRTINLSGK
ncbi:hypothetical protein CAPTEDRAFT_197036 [Capitella teleta]|uniref:Platelet-derived growth factor (PDGF) family profile domain-containing protein n=1 Tax=Capitella teleta TaxID=283909 RepID=R7V6F6_CAPTE|nr:hypothetical protein CAPTEDRAFT_197036 [Capitella teleta]|eukprot:ELU14047.1 hypothetical protein CAPTEDRAFT_197036 [Capitella teleta]